MKIKQILLNKMAVFTYIIADESTKTCALIDPAFEMGRILSEIKKSGYKLTHLINTHHHSDHSAGNGYILNKNKNAKLLIHKDDAKSLRTIFGRVFSNVIGGGSSPEPDVLLKNGDIISLGKTNLSVIHTPGHTKGGICILAEGNLFTGDTLFVGNVGRTDLPGGSPKVLLNSIKKRLYTLPDKTVVWPGHNYGSSKTSTIGREKRSNPFTMQR